MFLVFFIPVLIMYPFSGSPLNVFAVLGFDNMYTIEKHTDEAYVITMLGFVGVYIGRYFYDIYKRNTVIDIILKAFAKTIGQYFNSITKSAAVSRGFTLFYTLILLGFVCFIFSSGLSKNPREFFKINTQYAPIYTFILFTYQLMFTIISTRVLQYNSIIDKILFSALVIFGFFLGVRAPVILQSLSFGVLYVLFKKKGHIPIGKTLLFVTGILAIVMIMAFIRNSNDSTDLDSSMLLQSFLPEVFYGNTFSDIRDFSWVLGYWDKKLYWGMSYFAAFMSFIPSSIFPIRDTYGIGKITVGVTGLDLTTHPGLRMGIFGEMYLNFGIIGVVIFGFLWGYVLRRVDVLTKIYLKRGDVVKASSIIVYSGFVSYLTGSSGFWGFYISIFLLFFLYIATRIRIVNNF